MLWIELNGHFVRNYFRRNMMNKPNCTVGKRKQVEVIINRYDKGSKGRFKLYREKVIMEILEYQEQKSINTKGVKK
jgi:hypothetical protein